MEFEILGQFWACGVLRFWLGVPRFLPGGDLGLALKSVIRFEKYGKATVRLRIFLPRALVTWIKCTHANHLSRPAFNRAAELIAQNGLPNSRSATTAYLLRRFGFGLL